MTWIKKGNIFNNDSSLSWSKSHAQVPIVEKLNTNELRIYYSTRDSNNESSISFFDVNINNPSEIIYVHEKPIFLKGNIGTFDDSGVMPAYLLKENNIKYLYYIGWTTGKTVSYRNSIGLSISTDNGKTFNRYCDGPIIGTGMHDSSFTGTFTVYKEKNLYHGFYLSCNKWLKKDSKYEPIYDIKYTYSKDKFNWIREGHTAIPLKKEEGGIASSTIVKVNNSYLMWYSYRKKFNYRRNRLNSYKIGFSVSRDLKNWKRKDNEVGIEKSKNGWDSEMMAYPYVIAHKDKLLMFYNGNFFGKTGIGYAEKRYR